ncbi:MAG TPA: polysaccharide deacetylase family protein [Gemmatimonadaceae bacterium]|nr:polysaccharide deacetylase family protein [Gemmatimonadaceae bacterium]
MIQVSLGIDVEPDCPPYLSTQYRGVEEGLPRVLDHLDAAGIPVTCFCTGQVAERFPHRVADIITRGHELASHGHSHQPFDTLDAATARRDITLSTATLRSFGAPVTSFRAPNLRFPDQYLPLLEEQGFLVDSSQAKYKRAYYTSRAVTSMTRVPASMTSSVLRLPAWIRDPWLLALASPVVLFVHPWEFVDLRRAQLRLDCRFRTGDAALHALDDVIRLFRNRDAAFVRMTELRQKVHRSEAA